MFDPKLSLQHIAIKEGKMKPSVKYYLHLTIPKLLGSTQANRRNDKFLNHLESHNPRTGKASELTVSTLLLNNFIW